MSDLYLAHHGVKGQKWGVRRYQNPDGTRTAEGKKRASKDVLKERKNAVKKENLSQMSDEELNYRIGRLQQEKKLKELTAEQVSPGAKAAKDVIRSIGTKVITTAAVGAIAYAGKKAIESGRIIKINPNGFAKSEEELRNLAGYMFPNPNKKK